MLIDLWLAVAWFLPPIGLAGAALWIGYLAYDARQARERASTRPTSSLWPDAVTELARINAAMKSELGAARTTLEATRETLRRGIKG